jgi:hypothetical protein
MGKSRSIATLLLFMLLAGDMVVMGKTIQDYSLAPDTAAGWCSISSGPGSAWLQTKGTRHVCPWPILDDFMRLCLVLPLKSTAWSCIYTG